LQRIKTALSSPVTELAPQRFAKFTTFVCSALPHLYSDEYLHELVFGFAGNHPVLEDSWSSSSWD